MSGGLRPDIIEMFKTQFENNCVSLLFESYTSLFATGRNFLEDSENDITAQLVGFMKKNPMRNDLQISVEREHYLDSEEVYEGIVGADTSPRIDIIYTTWHSNNEHTYHIEAKLLAENNWKKASVITPVHAENLQKRYIATGINNFCSKKYSNGCLIGYILEGEIPKIVEKLNILLKADTREKENLYSTSTAGHSYSYLSDHVTVPLTLKHFFFYFLPSASKN